ncbi:MAG: hypothetical protein ACK42C_00140 [Aquificaceae bacterium]
MKKFLALVLFSSSVFASVCDRDFRQDLPFAPSDLKVLSKREISEGLCELLVLDKTAIVPLYVGKDFVLVGTLFRRGQDLTTEARNKARAELLKDRIKER